MPVHLRALVPGDWPAVAAIYAEGLATGQATFETVVPTWEAWDRAHRPSPRLGAIDEAELVGWAAVAPASARACYAGVGEVSVYVAAHARGTGVGRRLLDGLVHRADAEGLWTLQASIFPENEASVRLHRAAGFRVIGRRERIAQLAGIWRSVVLLERRSLILGRESPIVEP